MIKMITVISHGKELVISDTLSVLKGRGSGF